MELKFYRAWGRRYPLLIPQVNFGSKWRRYRVDFRVADSKTVVEVDGHEWHQKNKAQVARDRERDRWFQAQGYQVVRFTGSEVYEKSEACCDELRDILVANKC